MTYVQEKSTIRERLMAMEDWLYEDGFDATKDVYVEQLNKLHEQCDPPRIRKTEAEARPAAISNFFETVERFKTFANSTVCVCLCPMWLWCLL